MLNAIENILLFVFAGFAAFALIKTAFYGEIK